MRPVLTALALSLLALGAGTVPVAAQEEGAAQDEGRLVVELRVIATGQTTRIVVDRGSRDGLAVGDRVRFFPRDGGVVRGIVRRVDERSAVVELRDRDAVPATGTRGEARIPPGRFEGAEAPDPRPPRPRAPDREAERPPWQNEDEEWTPDMPLLARVRAVRPEARARRTSGRVYLIADGTWTSESGRADHFLRLGTDVDVENPFGNGGNFHVDLEQNQRRIQIPDGADRSDSSLRVDRLSYAWGGTRFAPERWEVGRFLQYGMPEFGFLDGVEWGRRRENGDRYGASLGYMPLPDADFGSGDDLQFAGYYQHVIGDREQLTLGGGVQKTFHDADEDRDLLIGKLTYLPIEGWDFHGSAWIDLYRGDDVAKDAGFELTQVWTSLGRRWETGNGLDFTYRRVRFPELIRAEIPPVAARELARNRNDRVAVDGWRWIGDDAKLHGVLGGWKDEDEAGGDLELGLGLEDLFADRHHGDATFFATAGQFSSVVGTRFSYGATGDSGGWDAFYEVANHHQDGFSDDRDDIVQHRLGASRSYRLGAWNLYARADSHLFDEDGSWSVELYLQRNF